jgi:CheY-like chemotaxis protein
LTDAPESEHGGLAARPSSAASFGARHAQFSPRDKPKFTGHRHCTGGILDTDHIIPRGATALLGLPHGGSERTARGGVMKKLLVSVVEDDRYFRESMGRLMRSLGYNVEAFSSAADFLASSRLIETTCLIADVHMPAMTGIELYRHLIEAGYTIPTILVTAYPDDVDRARALNDGVVCYLRKPVDEQHLIRCLRAALESGEPGEQNS